MIRALSKRKPYLGTGTGVALVPPEPLVPQDVPTLPWSGSRSVPYSGDKRVPGVSPLVSLFSDVPIASLCCPGVPMVSPWCPCVLSHLSTLERRSVLDTFSSPSILGRPNCARDCGWGGDTGGDITGGVPGGPHHIVEAKLSTQRDQEGLVVLGGVPGEFGVP